MGSRVRVAGWGLVLAALVLPVAVSAAPGWPSSKDVMGATPGIVARDAACVARFYRGKLSRAAWFTPYHALTRAQKIVTDGGFDHCMTKREQVAMLTRGLARDYGKHPENACVARRIVGLPRSARLATTTKAAALRRSDGEFRACGLTGVVYAAVAAIARLPMTGSERVCANRLGSAHLVQGRVSKSELSEIGTTLDRCVGRASEETMWRRMLVGFKPKEAIGCIARQVAASTTITVRLSDPATWRKKVRAAVTRCTSPTQT